MVSPFAKKGAVLHARYDLVSVVRSIELILGMDALSPNDALAAPMYDAFSGTAAAEGEDSSGVGLVHNLARRGLAVVHP